MYGRLLLAALVVAGPAGAGIASASVLVGPDPLVAPDAGACARRCTLIGDAPAPADGVVVRWHVRSAASATLRLRLVQPVRSGGYRALASGPQEAVAAGQEATFAVRLPIVQDALLAVDGATVPDVAVSGTGTLATVAYDGDAFDDGAELEATGTEAAQLQVTADVEPDVDADGYGDETQDPHADLAVTGQAPERISSLTPFIQTYTVTNLGPDPSPGATLAGVDETLLAGDGCPASFTAPSSCALGALAVGASLRFDAVFLEPAIFPPPPGVFSSAVRVTGQLYDPVAANDDAALRTLRDPYRGPVGPPPATPLVRACGNVSNGTHDDDVLRGTAFGDRIGGSGGADLIKGGAGDDCLSGGAGPDVVDGQAGDDQVAGGLGNDSVLGGAGDDRLTGGLGRDRLSGGAGADVIAPGPGRDRVVAGAGADDINARDGARDVIDCGPGVDAVRADRKDLVRHCEQVSRR